MPNIISMIYNIEAMRRILGETYVLLNVECIECVWTSCFQHEYYCFAMSPWRKCYQITFRERTRVREREKMVCVCNCFVNIFHLNTVYMEILWEHLLSTIPLHDTLTFPLANWPQWLSLRVFSSSLCVQFTAPFIGVNWNLNTLLISMDWHWCVEN